MSSAPVNPSVTRLRNYKIVNLRAIAILTVVIGHSIIIYSSEWNMMQTSVECPFFDSLKHIINLYQMQLYFFISGFLMYGTLQKNVSFNQFLKDKVRRILVPYFFVGLLWMIPVKTLINISDFSIKQLFSQIINLIDGVSNGHLWFLYSLFTIFLFFFIANSAVLRVSQYKEKYLSNKKVLYYMSGGGKFVILIMFLGLIVLSNYIGTNYFSIISTMQFIIWFYIGLLVKSSNRNTCLFVLILFALLVIMVMPSFVYGLIIVLTLYFFVPNIENKFMSFFDKYSYGLYLFHSPLIYIAYTYAPNINPLLMFTINFFGMGGVALLLSYIVKSRNIINI